MFVDTFLEEEISDYPAHGPTIRVLTASVLLHFDTWVLW